MKQLLHVSLLAMLVGWPPSGPAMAQTYTVLNHGFEDVSLGDGVTASGASSWSTFPGISVTLNPTAAQFPGEAPEGQNVLRISDSAIVTQGLGTIVPGTYTLTAQVGLENGGTFNNLGLRLRGNTLLLVASSQSSPAVSAGGFQTWTRTYDILPTNANASAIGTNLNIHMLASAASGSSAAVDNVQLTFTPVAVPEPSTLALLGLAVSGAVATWRYRRLNQRHERTEHLVEG